MDSQKKISRRQFLGAAAGVIGAGCLAVTGAGVWATRIPASASFPNSECGENEMAKKILVAYATRAGSTGEVAQIIGEVLCQSGLDVTVRRVQDVKDIKGFDAVVVGTPYRMEKPIPESTRFLNRYKRALAAVPVAFFTLGVTMNQDTPENRVKAEGEAEPMKAIVKPVSLGLFGGKVDPAKLEPIFRFALSYVKEGEMAPGDHRDMQAVRAWAEGLPAALQLN